MPSSAKTPAPPQRFLPSSSDQLQTPKLSWHKPGSTGQGVRFSASTVPTSTQFATVPRFGKASSRVEDDIDTSFEDKSSPLYPRHEEVANKFLSGQTDLVDDEDAADRGTLREKSTKVTDLGADLGKDGALEDPNVPNIRRPSSKFKDLILEVPEEEVWTPPFKRRRTSPATTSHGDAIIISSSEGDEGELVADVDDEQTLAAHHNRSSDGDRNMSVSPSHIPSTTASRFRMPAQAAPSRVEALPRKMFKFAPSQKAEDSGPFTTALLPDAFSPSRRRGRKDYLPGRSAETVRNWVLGLAATESKSAYDKSKTLHIVDARNDVEGRCTTVEDENHAHWLLIGQEGRNGAAGWQQSHAGSLKVGDTVEVRTAGTAWDLGLAAQAKDSAGRGKEEVATKDNLNRVRFELTSEVPKVVHVAIHR